MRHAIKWTYVDATSPVMRETMRMKTYLLPEYVFDTPSAAMRASEMGHAVVPLRILSEEAPRLWPPSPGGYRNSIAPGSLVIEYWPVGT